MPTVLHRGKAVSESAFPARGIWDRFGSILSKTGRKSKIIWHFSYQVLVEYGKIKTKRHPLRDGVQRVEKVISQTGGREKPSQTPKFFPSLQTSHPIPWLVQF